MKKSVLVLADYYVPAVKGGGAVRSLATQVEALAGEVEFHIITRDHDLGENRPFAGISRDVWVRVGEANVYYTRPGWSTMRAFWRTLKELNPDIVYLGSVVAVWYSIVPIMILRLTGWLGNASRQLIIAPHGQFGEGALRVKAIRKRVYLGLSRLIGFHNGIIWRASNAHEAAQVRRWMGGRASIRIAVNFWKLRDAEQAHPLKQSGSAIIIYVSRISPEKNLLGAVRLLARVSGQVEFRIFGPIASNSYWDRCMREIERLPGNIVPKYSGVLDPDAVLSEFGRAHLFLYPTPGENFGHVILEALSAGCPVLCSDRTPWGEIAERRAGWVERLDDTPGFVRRLEETIDMDTEHWLVVSRNARNFAELYARRTNALEQNQSLYQLRAEERPGRS